MLAHQTKLGSLLALAIALFFAVGFFSSQPAGFRGDNCMCHYDDGGLGTPVGSGSPSCTPAGGLTLTGAVSYYFADDGRCIRVDCEDPMPCSASGNIQVWSNSPCKISITSGGLIMAVAYNWVGTEFYEELDCGDEVTYTVCVGSVPMHEYTHTCMDCPL